MPSWISRKGISMKTRHRVLLASTAAVSMAAVTACSPGGGGGGGAATDFSQTPTGTLNAWGFENADDVGQARLDYAAAQLSGVDIQIEATAFDAQRFTAATASGSVPDVVQMSARFVGTFAAQGLIQPLDECLAANSVDASRWYDSVMADVTYDGQVYAVPQFYQPPAIITNTRLLAAAGLAPEDIDTSDRAGLLAQVQSLYTESGGNPSTLGLFPDLPGSAGLWFLGGGGSIIDDQGRPTLDDPANVETLTFLKELMDAQGGFAAAKSFADTFDMFGAENQFVKDQVAMGVYAQWYPNVLAATQSQITINAVPFKDQDGNPFTVASGTAFVVPVGAQNPAAACAWALNLTSDAAWMAAGEARATTIAEDPDPNRMNTGLFTGSPSADQAIREAFVVPTGNAGFDQVIDTYYTVASEGQSYGSSAAGLEIDTELQTAVTAALNGEKEPAAALADAQAAAMRAWEQSTGQ